MMRLFCLLSVCYLWFCGFGGKQEGKVSDSALYVLKDKAYGHISKANIRRRKEFVRRFYKIPFGEDKNGFTPMP